MSFNYFTGV